LLAHFLRAESGCIGRRPGLGVGAGICEHGIGGLAVAFPKPLTQCADHFFAQRDPARFASFTGAAHVSSGF